MLKSATALVGIIFGLLATAELAVSPSGAQQLQPKSAFCRSFVADWTRCRNGRFERCKQIAIHVPDAAGGCVWETRCRPAGRGCLARPS
jgi:hypothetical protein